jgi:hypothetical protein
MSQRPGQDIYLILSISFFISLTEKINNPIPAIPNGNPSRSIFSRRGIASYFGPLHLGKSPSNVCLGADSRIEKKVSSSTETGRCMRASAANQRHLVYHRLEFSINIFTLFRLLFADE